MARGDDDQRTELGRALKTLRLAAGLNQDDVVERTHDPKDRTARISQARLSRIEQGKAVPTEKDVAALMALYGADSAQRRWITGMTRDALAGVKDTRLIVQRGQTLAMQRRWRRLETESRVIRSFHPVLVLGVLQTQAYASVILSDPATIADRQARREGLLTRDVPHYVLIQTEGALRYQLGSAALMVEQLDAIVAASQRPNVEFGVIPWRHAVRVVPTNGFHLHDDHTVVVGLHVAAATLTAPADVAEFAALFERLSKVAVWGEEARVELRRISADMF